MMLTPLTNKLNAPIIYSFYLLKVKGVEGGASFYLLKVKGVEGVQFLFIKSEWSVEAGLILLKVKGVERAHLFIY